MQKSKFESLISNFVEKFQLDNAVEQDAKQINPTIQHCPTIISNLTTNNEKERYLAICSLFLASRQRQKQSNLSLNKILSLKPFPFQSMLDHVFGTETIVQNQPTSQTPLDDETSQAFLETQQDYSFKLVDFFELLNVCISNLHIENSEFYKETLILVQKKYMSFDGLFQFYCKFFSKFFWQKKEDAIKDVLLFVTGWLGFLMCMNKLCEETNLLSNSTKNYSVPTKKRMIVNGNKKVCQNWILASDMQFATQVFAAYLFQFNLFMQQESWKQIPTVIDLKEAENKFHSFFNISDLKNNEIDPKLLEFMSNFIQKTFSFEMEGSVRKEENEIETLKNLAFKFNESYDSQYDFDENDFDPRCFLFFLCSPMSKTAEEEPQVDVVMGEANSHTQTLFSGLKPATIMKKNATKLGAADTFSSVLMYQLRAEREVLFLENEDLSILPFYSKPNEDAPISHSAGGIRSLSQPTSQLRNMLHITPLESTLFSIQLTKDEFLNQKDHAADLRDVLIELDCEPKHMETLEAQVQSYLEKVEFIHGSQRITYLTKKQDERKIFVRQFFYQVLGEMMKDEIAKKTPQQKILNLLENLKFIKSLFICAAETILFGYNLKSVATVENMISLFELQPFDFCKMIESFVLNAPWFPNSFVTHFQRVENLFLEKYCWRNQNSALFTQLEQYKDSLLASNIQQSNMSIENEITNPKQTPMRVKKGRALNIFNSPAPKAQNIITSVSGPTLAGQAPKSISFFLRKLYKLVSHKIHNLCDSISLAAPYEPAGDSQTSSLFNSQVISEESVPQNQTIQQKTESLLINDELKEKIWQILYAIIHFQTNLLKNRHLDQMVMCAIYAVVAKVHKMKQLTFRDIIFHYRKTCDEDSELSQVEVGRTLWEVNTREENEVLPKIEENLVKIEDNSEILVPKTNEISQIGDIVKFYNQVFIPKLKNIILKPDEYLVENVPQGSKFVFPKMPSFEESQGSSLENKKILLKSKNSIGIPQNPTFENPNFFGNANFSSIVSSPSRSNAQSLQNVSSLGPNSPGNSKRVRISKDSNVFLSPSLSPSSKRRKRQQLMGYSPPSSPISTNSASSGQNLLSSPSMNSNSSSSINILGSPSQDQKMFMLLTPKTRALYSFSETHSNKIYNDLTYPQQQQQQNVEFPRRLVFGQNIIDSQNAPFPNSAFGNMNEGRVVKMEIEDENPQEKEEKKQKRGKKRERPIENEPSNSNDEFDEENGNQK